MSIIEKAKEFALQAHYCQKYGNKNYSIHLGDVVAVLSRFDINDEAIIASAWLHDVLEDTPISKYILEKEFGKEISDIVELVTDKNGNNRRERQSRTYPFIKLNYKALIVKLADRIANTENSKKVGGKYWSMYKNEYSFFKESLQNKNEQNKDVINLTGYLDFLYS